MSLRVALIQLNSGTDKAKNIAKALDFCRRAIKGRAKFILLPEMFNLRGKNKSVESIPGESLKPLMELAKKSRVFILAGSICEVIAGNKRAFNTSTLIDPHGRIKAIYRKTNLFRANLLSKNIDETKSFVAGKKPVMVRVNNFNVGLSVCFDLRFAALFQSYAAQGADVLCVPSAFTKETGRAHWEVLLRARAIENLSYVLAPNQAGKDPSGVESFGHSMVVSPWGEVIARASANKEEIIFADLNYNEIKKARKILPIKRKSRRLSRGINSRAKLGC